MWQGLGISKALLVIIIEEDMTVCIAEKPSVAQDIAKVLGADNRHEGYFEGNGYQVTWTFGHLCCLKSPEEYDGRWKRWSLSSLPIIPKEYDTRLIDNAGVRKQFKIIKKLFSKATCIINCGDAGQEGELIQRWVMQMSGVTCPVKRLWISSLTEEAIRKGFRELKPQGCYDNLYHAGMARAAGDWLLGMNATRLYTLCYGGKDTLLSIGRVQTPTLALIVNREKEIKAFRPETYWLLKTVYRGVTFTSADGKYGTKSQGEETLGSIYGRPLVIDSVNRKTETEAPPQLYDLTSLQVECNKRYGYSAETTLKTIQSLYERKLTTYPRVDTRYLSEDIYPRCHDILSSIQALYPLTVTLLRGTLRKSRRVFDSSRVTDHHAIIPTGRMPSTLSEKEQRVYDLIARRFVSVFMEDCTLMATVVMAHIDTFQFKATGKEVVNMGWKEVYSSIESNDKEDQTVMLPTFVEGEHGCHTPQLEEKRTAPPKPYTEATLLRAMETAGKFVEDEELRAALKQNGIGRPSSRAGIIETLCKRGYVRRDKRNLVPTQTGIALIATIRSELLKSCELTGQWEKKLREIEYGQYDHNLFLKLLEKQISDIIEAVNKDVDKHRITSGFSRKGASNKK